jgi:CheY-like chemotaxis protein
VKFTEQGSIKLQVLRQGINGYRFEVRDTGVGISPSGLLDVLKPFQQGDAGISKGGTGLGLAIAKRQIELMASDLEVESELGKGSRFSFALELPVAENEIVVEREPRRHAQLYLPENRIVNALVVDDVADNREVLVQLLEKSGVMVRSAVQGKDAIQKMSDCVPDIVFMDIRMPLMNGSQAMLHIKNNFPDVICVAVTSAVLYHERAMFLKQGFDDLVGKPFRIEQVISCIEKHLDITFEYASEATAEKTMTAN